VPDTADAQTQIQREIAEALRALVQGQRPDFSAAGAGWPLTDPSKLTTDAVNQATEEWRRELTAAIRILETRLAGMDTATELNAERIDRILPGTRADLEHVRSDFDRQSDGLRELIQGLKDLLGERIDGIDTATKLTASQQDKFPTDIDRSAAAVREYAKAQIELAVAETRRVGDVTQEKFDKVDAQFVSNDKALTAALAAQEKAAAEQQKSNTLAIDKSEKTTQETIRANQAQTQTSIESQGQTIADLKDRLVRIESGGLATAAAHNSQLADDTYSQSGRIAQQAQAAAGAAAQRATISLVIAGIVGLVGIFAALFAVIHG
jgi:hypothetical protein